MTKRHHRKEFLNAVNKRCFKKIETSVAKTRNINLPLTSKGETALHLAVIQNDLNLIKFLLSLGADINSTTNKKETVLHLAMDNDNPGKAKYKQSPSFIQHNEDIVKFLLNQSVDVNAQDVTGQSVLHIAVMSSNENNLNLLLKTKIDINLAMNNGSTALHCVMKDFVDNSRRMSMAASLVESGAQINIQNKIGETALHMAIRLNNVNLATYLISKGADVNYNTNIQFTTMFVAIKHCNLKMMRLLIKNGAKVNVVNSTGDSLLHYALKKIGKGEKRLNLVKLLLRSGLDVNAKNRQGRTALFIALAVGDEDLVNILLKHGISPNIADCFDVTPLHVAIKHCNLMYIQLLVSHGAVANENSISFPKNAEPLICQAIRLGRLTLIEPLLDFGSDMHKSDIYSRTPLNDAISINLHDVTNLLLSRGVNVNLKDRYGDTALHLIVWKLMYSIQEAKLSILRTLLSLGADVSAENEKGFTPLTMIFNSPRYKENQVEPCFTLVQHMALITARYRMEPIGVKNINAIFSRPDYFFMFQLCLKEIGLMQKTKIGNSNVFYYDLLTGVESQLIKYAQKVDVVETMEAENCKLPYSSYYRMHLMVNYTRGKRKLNLLQQATEKLVGLAPVKLPTEIATYICEHLSTGDLVNLEKTTLPGRSTSEPVKFTMNLRKMRKML